MSWKVIKPIPFNPFKINGVEYKNSLELAMRVEELEKENAELKRDKEDLIFIRNQRAKCMCEDKDLLTKAKEIIKKLTEFVNNEIEYDPEHPQLWNGLCKQAEQFLQEIEK